MNYREALAWLYGTQRFGIKLGLESARRLFAELTRSGGLQTAVNSAGDLEIAAPCKVIHVAGTNGKGSVCAMIDSILRAQGYRTGLFTSPHLVTFRERIKVSGEMISESAAAANLSIIHELVADWEPHPTFFEIATAVALRYFSESRIDIAILETGLGGRLDATNAVQPNVSVITPIDLDHQKWLGDTLKKIAGEKAGIIKANTPIVSAIQRLEAEQVIHARAGECDAPLKFISEPCHHPVALAGAHQKQNAALAIAALRAGEIAVDEDAISRGLASVSWPARFQRWDEQIVIDGAHNPAGAQALAKTWQETFGSARATVILAVLGDKDVAGIWRALSPITRRVLLPQIRSERALSPEDLAQMLSTITPKLHYSITTSIADALELARAEPHPILLTGSLHFAGEALATLQGIPAAFEECAQ